MQQVQVCGLGRTPEILPRRAFLCNSAARKVQILTENHEPDTVHLGLKEDI